MMWNTPPKEVMIDYLTQCDYYAKNGLKDFKRDPKYTTVLEGNERVVGTIALNSIKRNGFYPLFKEHLAIFREKERLGNPKIRTYGEIKAAPSTIRYANSFFDIYQVIGPTPIQTIYEVGGGYGGLCKTLSRFIPFSHYYIIDLAPAARLCVRYLSEMGLDGRVVCSDEKMKPPDIDLFIADSSVAECDIAEQKEYFAIAKTAKYFYVVYNTVHVPQHLAYILEVIEDFKKDFHVDVRGTFNEQGKSQGVMLFRGRKRI